MPTTAPKKHVGIRLRIKPPKRRTPIQRLKARLYYRRNKSKIKMQRRRYLRKWKTTLKKRKLFKRFKPTWFKHTPKHTVPHKKPHSFKIKVPKPLRPTKFKPHKIFHQG